MRKPINKPLTSEIKQITASGSDRAPIKYLTSTHCALSAVKAEIKRIIKTNRTNLNILIIFII